MTTNKTQKTVVITGASSGFGLLTALAFARQNFHVIASMRDPAKQGDLLTLAHAQQCLHNIKIARLDITCEASIQQFAQGLTQVDILVNNAGFAYAGFVEDCAVEAYQKQFATNFFGVIAITQAVLPLMLRQKSGRIINVSSISGIIGFPGISAYVASKHALEGWSECLRLELATENIHVSLIEPGSYQTNIWSSGTRVVDEEHVNRSRHQSFYASYEDFISKNLAKMGNPTDVADKIVSIAQTRKPRLRYPIGKGVRLMIAIKSILPWNIWQRCILKAFKNAS